MIDAILEPRLLLPVRLHVIGLLEIFFLASLNLVVGVCSYHSIPIDKCLFDIVDTNVDVPFIVVAVKIKRVVALVQNFE